MVRNMIKSGSDFEDMKVLVNTIAVSVDIIDSCLNDLQPHVRQNMKVLVNDALKHTKKFVKFCDGIFQPESQINFGDAADKMREEIDKFIREER